MIQLGYYSQQQTALDESNDFENYDPSDFLMKKDEPAEYEAQQPVMQEQEQMQYQQEYYSNIQDAAGGDEVSQQNFYSSFSQQQFSTSDYNFQQPMQEDLSQSQPPPPVAIASGGGLDDLDISDSDDDEPDEPEAEATTSQNQADTSKDEDDGLWF